jgi:2-methylcitrate dehydratase PrpD
VSGEKCCSIREVMVLATKSVLSIVSEFVASAQAPDSARQRAAAAFCDTTGVILAGAVEPAARIVRSAIDGHGRCHVLGTSRVSSAGDAALANGVAAHALDYDDMCFVSMAHPSCALVPAVLAAAESSNASGRTALNGYVAGFELECRLGSVMNPRHYHTRGWHCTSSIGTLGAAAAAARVMGLDAAQIGHALGIAASLACGLKENIGTMTKPLHAGIAARHAVTAAVLARSGFTASEDALTGPQGYLAAMDSGGSADDFARSASDLGMRWEIEDTGISVKLYPSCAATHPPLDVLLDLVRGHALKAEGIDSIDVEVDTMTPRLLIYDRPQTGLEAKFSMPFCAAAAVVFGHPTIDAFDDAHIRDASVQALMPRVTLRANPAFDAAAPLSQARVSIRLRSGDMLSARADGARGYPGRLTDAELATKFLGCARRSLSTAQADAALAAVRFLDEADSVHELAASCAGLVD